LTALFSEVPFHPSTGVKIMDRHGWQLPTTVANEKLRRRNAWGLDGIYVPKRPIRGRHPEGLPPRRSVFVLGFSLQQEPNVFFEGPLSLPGPFAEPI
jgi:hypothetical protein